MDGFLHRCTEAGALRHQTLRRSKEEGHVKRLHHALRRGGTVRQSSDSEFNYRTRNVCENTERMLSTDVCRCS